MTNSELPNLADIAAEYGHIETDEPTQITEANLYDAEKESSFVGLCDCGNEICEGGMCEECLREDELEQRHQDWLFRNRWNF